MTEGRSDRGSVKCELLRESPSGLAWLIEFEGEEVWIPKSQGELYKREDGGYTLFAEKWLLKKKGLI